MKKILFIVPYPFYNLVGHAGGKTVNHYFNCFNNDIDFDVRLAYFGNYTSDYVSMVEQYPSAKIFSDLKNKKFFKKLYDAYRFRLLFPVLKKLIPKYYITNNFHKEQLLSVLKITRNDNFFPDIIICEFDRTIYWINEIKRIFPDAFFVGSCHDVTYLSVERAFAGKKNTGFFYKRYYLSAKQDEINRLNLFNLVVVLNNKDEALLAKEKSYSNTNTYVLTPCYDTYTLNSKEVKDSVIFFGSMRRPENTDAVEWFLSNVWPRINECYKGKIRFKIVGGGLNKDKVQKYLLYDNVEVTGFVADPGLLFSRAFCFVVPLRLGAGIKIKVLDAMSSGIPVLTNDIGIEGIDGTPGLDYLHCNNADDYTKGITKLVNDDSFQKSIAANAKQLISKDFNLLNSYPNYKKEILKKFTAFKNREE